MDLVHFSLNVGHFESDTIKQCEQCEATTQRLPCLKQ